MFLSPVNEAAKVMGTLIENPLRIAVGWKVESGIEHWELVSVVKLPAVPDGPTSQVGVINHTSQFDGRKPKAHPPAGEGVVLI